MVYKIEAGGNLDTGGNNLDISKVNRHFKEVIINYFKGKDEITNLINMPKEGKILLSQDDIEEIKNFLKEEFKKIIEKSLPITLGSMNFDKSVNFDEIYDKITINDVLSTCLGGIDINIGE